MKQNINKDNMRYYLPGAPKEDDLVPYPTAALSTARTWPFPFGFNFLPGKRDWRKHIDHEIQILQSFLL